MYDFYMTVRSVTWGQKGRDALANAGLRCALLRAPREISAGSCAYALATRRHDAERAKTVLSQAGVSWQGCYFLRHDGSFARMEP